nr:hypothetical protein CFP56_63599 [Quercus suber]
MKKNLLNENGEDFSWRGNSGIVKDSDGEVVTSVIKGAACSSGNISLTLDISLRVEHGIDGQWQVTSSKIIEVGPVAAKPSGYNKPHSFKNVLMKGSGPKAHAAWKPKAQVRLHNALSGKPKSISVSSKPNSFLSVETKSKVAMFTLSSPACNSDVQLCESSPQPSVSDCHISGIGSSISVCANSTFACESPLSVPLQVDPVLGSSAAPSNFGLPQTLPSKPPLPTSDKV